MKRNERLYLALTFLVAVMALPVIGILPVNKSVLLGVDALFLIPSVVSILRRRLSTFGCFLQSLVLLFIFPIGTLIGVYGLCVLFGPDKNNNT